MKHTSTNPSLRLASLIAGLGAVSFVPFAGAADFVWNPPVEGSGGSASWANGLNWGGTAPADNTSDDIAVFNSTTAYNFQPTLDAFTVRSINGLRFGGASTVVTTLSASTGTRSTSGASTTGATTLTFADATGLQVGQLITGSGIGVGTFITGIEGNTVTLSRPTTGNTANNTTVTATSALNVGNGGITLLAGTPNVTNTITAPIVLSANQTWTNETTNRTLAIQGSVNLGSHTLTIGGDETGAIISFNGNSTTQSITGSGNIIIDTAGRANFGSGSGNTHSSTFTGGVTLMRGTLNISGGNSGNTGPAGNLGTGVLTINGGSLRGDGNIAGRPLAISGQVWNADWTYVGNRSIDMGVGEISLGTAAGASRTLTTSGGTNILTLGGDMVDGITAKNFIKAGASELRFNGDMLITGNTTISDGLFTQGLNSSFTFYIGADGVNNQINGAGTAVLNGSFSFNLDSAGTNIGDSWLIVDLSSLTATFAETFSVNDFTEVVPNSGIWVFGDYSFSEATGYLTYTAVPEPSAFAALAGLGVLGLVATRRRRSV